MRIQCALMSIHLREVRIGIRKSIIAKASFGDFNVSVIKQWIACERNWLPYAVCYKWRDQKTHVYVTMVLSLLTAM